MANSWKDTNWSQFFINEVSNTFLDYNKSPDTSKHSVFGQVIVWMEVVNKIADIETDKNNNKPTWKFPWLPPVINEPFVCNKK